jgi:hypothetical protein
VWELSRNYERWKLENYRYSEERLGNRIGRFSVAAVKMNAQKSGALSMPFGGIVIVIVIVATNHNHIIINIISV